MNLMTRLGLTVLLWTWFLPTPAMAGEDFPFFCIMQDSQRSFQVRSDLKSPTGYSIILYRHRRFDGRVNAELTSTTDGKYWLVKGDHVGGPVETHVMAYIGLVENRSSHGDIKVSRAKADGRGWDLKPLSCRRL